MAYFLGRDVDVFVALETAIIGSGVTVASDTITVVADASATFPSLKTQAGVSGGAVSDVTGVDLSIGVSDEDVGPFFGQLATQKIEIRKETTVSLTRKKSDNTYDVLFNGPSTAGSFDGTSANAGRMGARFGISHPLLGAAPADKALKISQGLKNPTGVFEADGSGDATTKSCYGYRVFVRLRDYASAASGEIYVVKNCAFTGHTVSLNADGTSEETMEFTATTTPVVHTPSALATSFLLTLSTAADM